MTRVVAAVAVMSALMLSGAAWAGGPLSVTVKQGTLTHGSAASLTARDSDTLDVVAKQGRSNYIVNLFADFGQQPSGQLLMDIAGWVTYGTQVQKNHFWPRCYFRYVQGDTPTQFIYMNTEPGYWTFAYRPAAPGPFTEQVRCRWPSPFTLHLDQLAIRN